MKYLDLPKLALLLITFLGLNSSAFSQAYTFNYTGSIQSFTIPSGVTTLNVDAWGAAGGAAPSLGFGGRAGMVQCTLAVTPGAVIYLGIGSKGAAGTGTSSINAGGYNGGGQGYDDGGGGGGAADIRMWGTGLANRVLVASGGGGATNTCSDHGGHGGGLTGYGGLLCGSFSGTDCGGPGSQTAGGSAATGAAPGSLGLGGDADLTTGHGGGGGAGYYGGGGGNGGSGGGGSSYTMAGICTGVIHTPGYNSSFNGKIVLSVPLTTPITGTKTICVGNTTTLSDATPGGTWTTTVTVVAVASGTSGIVTGISPGTTTVTYTAPGGSYAVTTVTVVAGPATIGGASSVCTGGTTTFTNSVSGGIWSNACPSIATVGASTGIVTGISPGTCTISYTLSTGCYDTKVITVVAGASPITGTFALCVGASTTLSDATTGGTWSSSTTSVSIAPTTGVATAITAGTAVISYTIGSGCFAVATMTVSPLPAAIGGASSVCVGAATTLTSATPGGTWSNACASIATVGLSTGIVTGITAGTCTITYSMPGGCFVTYNITVAAAPAAITGSLTACVGATTTLSDATTGGTWSSSDPTIATIGMSTGIATGVGVGTATIFYTTGSGCFVTATVTINPVPAAITGTLSACIGFTTTLADATSGGTWSSGTPAVATIGIGTGIVTGVTAGTSIITYALGTGCAATATVTIYPLPVITATSYGSCGSSDTMIATGGTTYSWSPATGLSCSTCDTTAISPSATTTYTVVGTSALGCSDVATVTLNGNRISGHITFSGATPDTLDMKVWLIQYDPTDSSITAMDSMLTCVIDSVTYYEFNSKPAGNYMVKAKMVHSKPVGTSGYIPTYGISSAIWSSAATVAHTTASDSIHINMIYGTVPAGAGFIGGNVYFGAGKGTSGTPVAGMLVYLQNTATNVLTYTYTDGTGAYAFSGLAYGSYVIYPEEYQYKTTPSSVLTLTAAAPSATAVDFKQYTTSRRILPYSTVGVVGQSLNTGINMFPNPASDELSIQWQNIAAENGNVTIADMTGREVLSSVLSINNQSGYTKLDLSGLNSGIYLVTINAGNIYYTSKLMIQQ